MSVTDEDPLPRRSGVRLHPFVFYAGYDSLDWAQPGDHLVELPDGPVQVMGEDGTWRPL